MAVTKKKCTILANCPQAQTQDINFIGTFNANPCQICASRMLFVIFEIKKKLLEILFFILEKHPLPSHILFIHHLLVKDLRRIVYFKN